MTLRRSANVFLHVVAFGILGMIVSPFLMIIWNGSPAIAVGEQSAQLSVLEWFTQFIRNFFCVDVPIMIVFSLIPNLICGAVIGVASLERTSMVFLLGLGLASGVIFTSLYLAALGLFSHHHAIWDSLIAWPLHIVGGLSGLLCTLATEPLRRIHAKST